jgi:hypothetical protein
MLLGMGSFVASLGGGGEKALQRADDRLNLVRSRNHGERREG